MILQVTYLCFTGTRYYNQNVFHKMCFSFNVYNVYIINLNMLYLSLLFVGYFCACTNFVSWMENSYPLFFFQLLVAIYIDQVNTPSRVG